MGASNRNPMQIVALAAVEESLTTAVAPGVSRRDFLKSAGAAGLVLSVPVVLPAKAKAAGATVLESNFVRIGADNLVHVICKHHEMGQGTTTGIVTLLAEELDADWSLVRAEYAPADAKRYNNLLFGPVQGTGGSTAMANAYEQMRKAGATARAMLVAAASQSWKVPAAEITTEKNTLKHAASGKSATYGEMAAAAAKMPVPAEVALKSPDQFTLIGTTAVKRLDSAAKCNGTAMYTIDVKLPGMLTAMITRPPAFGAKLLSFDATEAKKVAGVTDVVQVPEGVAVVGTGMWPVMKARKLLKLEWDLSGAMASSEDLLQQFRAKAGEPGTPFGQSPDTEGALSGAAKTVEAVYEFPFLAHAPMEPMNCVVWMHDGMLETWSGHQIQTLDLAAAAKTAGLPPEKVKLNSLISGGSFGRRANGWSDYTVEAVNVGKAIQWRAPLRLQFSREDDMRAGLYRPMYVHALKVGLDAQGALTGWKHTTVGQSIVAGTPFAMLIKDGVDSTTVEGVWPSPYSIPAFSGQLHSPELPVRPLWWRSVGNTHTAFVMETMMDELAAAAGKDPVEFRLALLGQSPRMAGVLKLAAEKGGWGGAVPQGHALGVAVHFSFETYVAQVVEVSVGENGIPKVHRAVVAVDCGVPINPDVIRAQMEGCVGFALSAALYGEIDIENGMPKQGNYNTYRVIRMPEMPVVEVHIVPSAEPPTGVGEPGVPPLAPAMANALFRLTGERTRRLPFVRSKPQTT
jgi:isoquinoline 1-oxidoreductase beta subunit